MTKRTTVTGIARFMIAPLAVGAAIACSGSSTAIPTGSATGTLPCDVDAILVNHCQKCHGNPLVGGAPMPLVTYADLQAPAPSDPSKTVHQMVVTRITSMNEPMPQPPNPRLDAADIATLTNWDSTNAPSAAMGTSCTIPDAGGPPTKTLSCTPDTTLAPASPFAMPLTGSDVYACYGVDVPVTGKRQIIGFAPQVDNAMIVHHLVVGVTSQTVSSTPTPCDGGNLFSNAQIVYVWAPGVQPLELPPQAGLPEEGTMHFVVQIHYSNPMQIPGQTDASKIQMCTTDQLRPNDADVAAFGSLKFDIPAHGTRSIDCTWPALIPHPVTAFESFLHMHKLGTSISDEVDPLGGGAPVPIGNQPNWDFNAQAWTDIHVTLNPGDTVRTKCAWNNTSNTDVTFGEMTSQEMCFGFVMYYPKIAGNQPFAPAYTSKCTSN
jgi:hypothetical protein